MDIIRQLEAEQAAKIEAQRQLPEFQPGDTVRVLVRRDRGHPHSACRPMKACASRVRAPACRRIFTVRKISYGEGVERVFPVYSPLVEGVRDRAPRQGSPRQSCITCVIAAASRPASSKTPCVRARKLNEAERQALAAEKAKVEADKVAAAQALAAEKAAAEAAEKKAAADAAAAENNEAEKAE